MKVLYVEDDEDLRELGELALGLDSSLDIRTADGGEAALALLDSGQWKPDLILLDVMMPDMDGPALLTSIRMRAGFAGTPVIFFTARSQPDELARYASLGACGVIAKPFDPLTLAARVRAFSAA